MHIIRSETLDRTVGEILWREESSRESRQWVLPRPSVRLLARLFSRRSAPKSLAKSLAENFGSDYMHDSRRDSLGDSFFYAYDLFRTLLSYVINFSSPVSIRFKNGSISCRFSSDSQWKLDPSNFWLLIHGEPKYRASFGIQSYLNGSKLFYGRCSVP